MARTVEHFVGVRIFIFFSPNDVKVMGNLVMVIPLLAACHSGIDLSFFLQLGEGVDVPSLPTSSYVALPQAWITVSPSWPQLQVRQ